MVPTTLTGLLLFVVLLLPGFAYLVGKERHGTERRLSPFRETVAIVAASITSELVLLAVFSVIRVLWPTVTPNVGALIYNSSAYLRGTPGHPGHYRIVGIWVITLLALATLGAYLATKPKVRRPGEKLEKLTGPYPHDSTVSAWWILFERWSTGRDVEVACMLDDGSAVRGQFGSFNTTAEDSPDRDLILQKPIFYRPSGENAREVLYPVSAACCPARRIVTLFVAYSERESVNSTRSQEREESEKQVEPVPPAASQAQSEAAPSAGGPTLVLGQSSTLPVPFGPSALREGLRALRFW